MYRWVLREYVGAGKTFFLAHGRITRQDHLPTHTHDHCEIVWGDSGRGFHFLNGEDRPFGVGSVVFVRPPDVHILRCNKPQPLRMSHAAFPVQSVADLERRYPGQWVNPFTFDDPAKREFCLRGARWNHFLWVVREVWAGPRNQAALDWFLLNISQLIRPMVAESYPRRWPAWLEKLYPRLSEPDVLRGGTPVLCDLADCTPQYLARAVRKHIGVTPTELLNETRLHVAAERLVRTDDQIIHIAADCGLHNLGHFYKLFHQKYGTTPRKYRLQYHERGKMK